MKRSGEALFLSHVCALSHRERVEREGERERENLQRFLGRGTRKRGEIGGDRDDDEMPGKHCGPLDSRVQKRPGGIEGQKGPARGLFRTALWKLRM